MVDGCVGKVRRALRAKGKGRLGTYICSYIGLGERYGVRFKSDTHTHTTAQLHGYSVCAQRKGKGMSSLPYIVRIQEKAILELEVPRPGPSVYTIYVVMR